MWISSELPEGTYFAGLRDITVLQANRAQDELFALDEAAKQELTKCPHQQLVHLSEFSS